MDTRDTRDEGNVRNTVDTRNGRVVKTDCTLCLHSCGVEVTVEDGRAVGVAGLKEHPLTGGELCPKGEAMLDSIYSPGTIEVPDEEDRGQVGADRLGTGPE